MRPIDRNFIEELIKNLSLNNEKFQAELNQRKRNHIKIGQVVGVMYSNCFDLLKLLQKAEKEFPERLVYEEGSSK